MHWWLLQLLPEELGSSLRLDLLWNSIIFVHLSRMFFPLVKLLLLVVIDFPLFPLSGHTLTNDPSHSISYNIASAPSGDADQPVRPRFLSRTFVVRLKQNRKNVTPINMRRLISVHMQYRGKLCTPARIVRFLVLFLLWHVSSSYPIALLLVHFLSYLIFSLLWFIMFGSCSIIWVSFCNVA